MGRTIFYTAGKPCAVKVARTVWGGGKAESPTYRYEKVFPHEDMRGIIMNFSEALRQEGRQEGLLEAARKMLSAGVDVGIVAQAMGLSRQKLAALGKK